MPRTSDELVRGVLGSYSDPNVSTDPFISAATDQVDYVAAQDTGSSLSSTNLTNIETWVAAHFMMQVVQAYQSKTTGKASATFQGQTGQGFASTMWGQTALRLDRTGTLARLDWEAQNGGRPVVQLQWLGTDDSGSDC